MYNVQVTSVAGTCLLACLTLLGLTGILLQVSSISCELLLASKVSVKIGLAGLPQYGKPTRCSVIQGFTHQQGAFRPAVHLSTCPAA